MMKLFLALVACLLPLSVEAQFYFGPPVSPGGLFVDMPADGALTRVYTVTDCVDLPCTGGTGSPSSSPVWVTKHWDGAAWINSVKPDGISQMTGNLNLAAGTIRGSMSVETIGLTGTETAAEGQWVFITAALTRTPPSVAIPGQSICYYTTGPNVLTIDPWLSDVFVLGGTELGPGVTLLSSGTAGDFACLLSDGIKWYILGISGTWIAGS